MSIDGDASPWSFYRYLVSVVLPDPSLGSGYRADKTRMELDDLFKDANPGDVVGVEDAPWETLKKAINMPQAQAMPQITTRCLAFQEAVINAPKRGKAD